MKNLLAILAVVLCFFSQAQTSSPWIDEMTSINNTNDKFRQVLGPTGNAGSHAGEMCYNISGTYIDEEYYSFESEQLDLLLWSEVSVEFTIESNIRTNDQFAFWYYDAAVPGWSGFDLSNLIGTYTITIPTSTKYISFDLSTISSNGGLNGKYAHVDRIVLSDPGSPLPIELISFEGHEHEGCNHLDWATASESNTDYYNIEWSRDGYTWDVIGTLTSAGNSNMILYYNFIDESPLPIINYYRLIQYDWDDVYEIFGPIAIDNRKKEKRIIKYVSLSGKEIDPSSMTGLVIGIYEDGTTIKVYL